MTLENKVVWITGSARRVGKTIAIEAAREGADIVVHCNRSRNEAETTASEIRAIGSKALVVQGDHAQRADVERIINEIDSHFGRLDALVNSASTFPTKPFTEISTEEFSSTIDANLRGPFLCAQLALPLLRAAKPGRIVNITDCMLPRPYPKYAVYWCAKGGLDALTRALARELAPDVLVNAVAPGPVLAPDDITEQKRENTIARTYLKRWGKPEDVACAVIYLLKAEYTTGISVPVDGGRSLG